MILIISLIFSTKTLSINSDKKKRDFLHKNCISDHKNLREIQLLTKTYIVYVLD